MKNVEDIFNIIKKKKYLISLIAVIITIIIIFSLLLFLIVKKNSNDNMNEELISLEEAEINEVIDNKLGDIIRVDIKGAVNSPGIYELNNESRVNDAIVASGGLTKEADTDTINLSKILKDEMVIIIYTKEEISEMRKGSISVKYVDKECICPKIANDACIEDKTTNYNNDNSNNQNSNNSNKKVSLNKGTLDELMSLTGIGESKAKAIIEYRNKNNGFKSIEEITNVSGIGQATYEKIKEFLTL